MLIKTTRKNKSIHSRATIQDLDKLEEYANRNLMRFNNNKCKLSPETI